MSLGRDLRRGPSSGTFVTDLRRGPSSRTSVGDLRFAMNNYCFAFAENCELLSWSAAATADKLVW